MSIESKAPVPPTTDIMADLCDESVTCHRPWTCSEPICRCELIERASKEIEQLRALVTRLTNVADDLARGLSDPGTEALAAIHCGRHFIYG